MQQTFLVELKDNNHTIDFFRHSEKLLDTIKRKEKTFWQKEYQNFQQYGKSLYQDYFGDNVKIYIYDTNNNDNLVFCDNFINFLGVNND